MERRRSERGVLLPEEYAMNHGIVLPTGAKGRIIALHVGGVAHSNKLHHQTTHIIFMDTIK